MCYLVAKWFDRTGSVAMRTEAGPGLVDMIDRIEDRFGFDTLQLVTITRPSAYGEYEPYTFVASEQDLVAALQDQAEAR